MQSIIKGHATFFSGTFEDKTTKKDIPYFQLCITEVEDSGVKLVKASVSDKLADEAKKFHGQKVEVLCDLKETNYNNKPGIKMVYLKAKAMA